MCRFTHNYSSCAVTLLINLGSTISNKLFGNMHYLEHYTWNIWWICHLFHKSSLIANGYKGLVKHDQVSTDREDQREYCYLCEQLIELSCEQLVNVGTQQICLISMSFEIIFSIIEKVIFSVFQYEYFPQCLTSSRELSFTC